MCKGGGGENILNMAIDEATFVSLLTFILILFISLLLLLSRISKEDFEFLKILEFVRECLDFQFSALLHLAQATHAGVRIALREMLPGLFGLREEIRVQKMGGGESLLLSS